MTVEQEREYHALSLWSVRNDLTDDQLLWMAESFPEFFEIKEGMFDMKKFKSTFNLD